MFIIKEIHSVQDITEEHKEVVSKDNPILRIDVTLIFHEKPVRQILFFHKSDWEEVKERGWFGIKRKDDEDKNERICRKINK